jgi:hypothetical protein
LKLLPKLTPATKVEEVESEPRSGANIGDYSGRLRLLSGASNWVRFAQSAGASGRPRWKLGLFCTIGIGLEWWGISTAELGLFRMIVSPASHLKLQTSHSWTIGFVCTTAYRLLALFGATTLAAVVTPAQGPPEHSRMGRGPGKPRPCIAASAQLALFRTNLDHRYP